MNADSLALPDDEAERLQAQAGEIAEFMGWNRPGLTLDTLARVIRESAPAHDPNGEPGDDLTHWARGCASACERVANACADSLDLRPSERAAFCAACGVANLSA